MDLEDKNYVYVKSAVYLIIFLILHYLYEMLPHPVFALFSGTSESVYEHMKIAFYSYIFLTIIEFTIFRKKINDNEKFVFSHLFSAVLIPWMSMMWYLIISVVYADQIPILTLEIIYSIAITYVSVIPICILEQWYSQIEFNKQVKFVILILLMLSIVQFTVFTFRLPWHDIFADPLA